MAFMAVRKGKAAASGWDDVPKRGEKFPNMYAVVKLEEHEVGTAGETGNALWTLSGRITDAGKDNDDYDDAPVYLRFRVGHDDDPEASDPSTWTDRKSIAAHKNYDVQTFAELARALKVKAEPGDADVLDEIDGESIGVTFGTNAKGYQTYAFWPVGDRDPGLIGKDDAVGRTPKGKKHEAEEEEETPPAKKRGR